MPVTSALVYTTSDNRQFIDDESGANAHQAALDAKEQIEVFVAQSDITKRVRPSAIRNIMAWEAWKSSKVQASVPVQAPPPVALSVAAEVSKEPNPNPIDTVVTKTSAVGPKTTRMRRVAAGK